jgi:hypothetical protein
MLRSILSAAAFVVGAADQQVCLPGHADPAFGTAGWISAPVGDLTSVLSDGRLAVIGRTRDRYDAYRSAVLDAAGALPPGSAPRDLKSAAGPLTHLGQVVRDDADRLLLPGGIGRVPARSRPVLLRTTSDGQADPIFGKAGSATLPRTRRFRYGAFHAAARLPDGRVVAAGTADGRLLVARFTAGGRLDRSFARGGVRILAPGRTRWAETAASIDVLPSGAYLISGEARRTLNDYYDDVRIMVARIERDGVRARRTVARQRLWTNGDVAGQAVDASGASIFATGDNGRLFVARVDHRGRLVAQRRLRVPGVPADAGHTIAGALALADGTTLLAATAIVDSEVRQPNGDLAAEGRETPIAVLVDRRGRLVDTACAATPTLPTGAWAASLESLTRAGDGAIAGGWTRQPLREEDFDGYGTGRPRLSPILFRIRLPSPGLDARAYRVERAAGTADGRFSEPAGRG